VEVPIQEPASVECEFGRLKNEWALLLLHVRGIDRNRLHADLTILAKLACALSLTRGGALSPARQLSFVSLTLRDPALVRGHALVSTPVPELSVSVLQKGGDLVRARLPAVPLLFFPDEPSLEMTRFAARSAGAS
jgi:hypothetical protein